MRSILYLVAVILLIGWAFAFFNGSRGPIHILLLLAIIAIVIGLRRKR